MFQQLNNRLTIGILSLTSALGASACKSAELLRLEEPAAVTTDTQQEPPQQELSALRLPGEESNPLSLSLSSQINSRYIANGVVFYDGPSLHSGARLSADTENGSLYVDLFNHTSLGNRGAEDFTELDVTLGASRKIGNFRLTFEHVSLLFPDSSDHIPDTQQVRGRIDWENSLLPTYLLVKYDYDELDFVYLEGGVQKPIQLTEELTLSPFLSISGVPLPGKLFNDRGISSVQGGVSLEWQPKEGGPSFFGSVQQLESFDNSDYNGLTVGFGLSWRF